MTPSQQGDVRLLFADLNALFLRADVLYRRIILTREDSTSEALREALGYLSSAESTIGCLLEAERSRERREASGG